MIRQSVKSGGPTPPKAAPAPGAASAVGLKPRGKKLSSPLQPKPASTRMYGKVDPSPAPDPFSGDVGPGRLGGI